MAGTISNYGDRQQIWNLGNNIIDTKKLVDLELQALEMKKSPYTTQKQTLTNENKVYASMKKEFANFVQVFKDLNTFKGDEKKTTLSKDGFMTAQADAAAIPGTYTITVERVAERHQITTAPLTSPKTPEGTEQKFSLDLKLGVDDVFQINGKEVKISKDMTYKDLVNKINNGNYGASVYTLGDQLFFTSTTAGKGGELKLTDGANGFLQNIGLVTSAKNTDGTNAIAHQVTGAVNAEYTINGIKGTSKTNKIDTIPGLTINLEKVTTEPIKLTIEDSDIKNSIDLIKKMKDEYNNAVKSLDLFSGENGVMQGNNVSFAISNAMTSSFRFSQDDKYLFSFGIQIDKTGNMTLDEEKLKIAFKENPESTKQFFFGFNGIGHDIDKKLEGIFGDEGIIGKRSKSIEKQVTDLERKIQDIDTINKKKQESIIDKYAKLESQLALLDSQLQTIKAMTKTKSDD
ncbi:flagellar filament capping protein FliD [Bacillus cereus]|uniref:flagellar hook-associated protein 2 n=1 Tax=Bacillus cereus TaxID=1396 RepID=UPI000BF50175|nr:flagellar hook-associated protein 2 [Bacillus cereus]PEY66930.1 flagellar filament capping protein FliD [Bacillus cereus]PFC51916.1 flagellar filament capping protein FliD [Bacillus cereus]PFJ95052.1 flagellar filament capping protein FliD [Bacillus cereus]PFL47864.1 flagellar filament capping protein FliD [Bacillus cereus]PFL93272.1 flagellar filament capping protein FliD [Bacillus cereus]